MSNADINLLLNKAVNMNASDIHIKVGIPPVARVNGLLRPIPDEPKLTTTDTKKMAQSIMNQKHWEEFIKNNELDLAYSILQSLRV